MNPKSDNNTNTRLSLKLLESVIAGVNDAVLITKAEPVEAPHGPEIIFVNKSFERISGYKAEEVIGKTPRILQGPKTESEELQKLRTAIKKQEAIEVEVMNYSKTGDEYWINISLSPIFKDGKCTHFISIQRDVSERVNIRKATEEVKERLEYAFKASEDILYDHDMVEDTILLSDNFQQIFGYSFADEPFTLEKWATLLHPDDEQKINSRLVKTLADKKANKWEAEFRYARKDGTYANVKENAYIIRDDTGKPVRMIGIVKDISEQKQQELKKELSSNISRIFNESDTLSTALKGTLFELKALDRFQLAELWLADPDSNSINLVAYIENEVSEFYDFKNIINSFKKGEGLPGKTWKSGKVQFWKNVDKRKTFIRREGAAKTGLKTAYGFPILYNNEVLGALLFGLKENLKKPWPFAGILEELAEQLGVEIHRKKLEEELARIYESAPDGIIVAGFDGYFKKVNPAMCEMLGYSEKELLSTPFLDFVHPDDRERTLQFYEEVNAGAEKSHYENRYITKRGKIVWLSWTFKIFREEKLAYTVAKDVTQQKEIEELYQQAGSMAKIGSWEVNLKTGDIFLSDTTEKIFEVEPGYNLTLEEGINFYKEGPHREKVRKAVEQAIENGIPYDIEVILVTQKGSEKWIRTIGKPEFRDGKCVRIYGSIQDIHDLKTAEENLKVKTRHIEAISKLNSALLNYQNWYSALSDHLKVIGEAVKSDRVYYFENRYDPETGEGYTTQKLEWCREGISPQLGNPDLDDIPFKEVPELIDPMLERKASAAILSDVNENCTTRNVMESQQIKAFMAIPVYVETRFHGFVGFDNCTSERHWSEEERTTLETITANLATAISRQRLDEQLLELFDEKNSILESIGDGFFAVNEDFTVTYWNAKAEELLFTPRDKIMNRYLWSVFNKEQAETSYKNYIKAFEERVELKFEDYYEPIDRWFDVNVYPTTDGISVFFKDITERKREQQLILEKTDQIDAIAQFNGQLITEEHWVQALDNSLEMFGSVAKADRVYFFENSRNETTGKLETSMKLEWVAEGIEPEIQNEVHHNQSLDEYSFLSSALKQRKAVSHVVKQIKDKKSRKFLESQDIKSILIIPVFTGRSFRGYIGFDDCTNERVWSDEEVAFLQTIAFNLASAIENEDAEQALEDAFEEKNEILESIGDAFFAVDMNWIVTYWNNIAEQLLGMPKEKIVGENLWDVYEDAVELDFYNQYHDAMENQVMVHFEEYYPVTGNWFEVSAYPSASGLSVFFKDVTDRKDSEQKLLELNKNLAEKTKALEISNAELEQFAFVASHDLQEPLRMISSFLTQLKRKYGESLDERAHKYIHFATDGAKRMRQIILDLLDYSRVGRIDTDRIEIDINELLDGVKKLHNRLIEEKQATVSWGRMPVITAAPAPMRQLFQNLFHNALYYHEAGNKPVVKIWAKELKNHWKFYIQDNGIGIEKEYSEKIFNIFQRLHLTDEFIGTGVGLAICKKIVEDHGGEIGVNSEVGKGSTFYFTIKKQY